MSLTPLNPPQLLLINVTFKWGKQKKGYSNYTLKTTQMITLTIKKSKTNRQQSAAIRSTVEKQMRKSGSVIRVSFVFTQSDSVSYQILFFFFLPQICLFVVPFFLLHYLINPLDGQFFLLDTSPPRD